MCIHFVKLKRKSKRSYNGNIYGKVILPDSVDFHTALNPGLVTVESVCILIVIVGPVLVKGPGMELAQNFSL